MPDLKTFLILINRKTLIVAALAVVATFLCRHHCDRHRLSDRLLDRRRLQAARGGAGRLRVAQGARPFHLFRRA
jgi:hypothetical protein